MIHPDLWRSGFIWHLLSTISFVHKHSLVYTRVKGSEQTWSNWSMTGLCHTTRSALGNWTALLWRTFFNCTECCMTGRQSGITNFQRLSAWDPHSQPFQFGSVVMLQVKNWAKRIPRGRVHLEAALLSRRISLSHELIGTKELRQNSVVKGLWSGLNLTVINAVTKLQLV